MGNTCSCSQGGGVLDAPSCPEVNPRTTSNTKHTNETTTTSSACSDPLIHDLVRRWNPTPRGQYYLLYKKSKPPVDIIPTEQTVTTNNNNTTTTTTTTPKITQTRLVQRRVKPDGTQIYAIRYPISPSEQRPIPHNEHVNNKLGNEHVNKLDPNLVTNNQNELPTSVPLDPFVPANMMTPPRMPITDWVCVSEESNIFVCDTGLSSSDCDFLVQTTEQVCKGNYAAYTYAKQTLGCREFPPLAQACFEPVHRVTHAILQFCSNKTTVQLDDREPHMVKYDITKKERQKLDMHTDKSEWTFLIALSDGCGLDYEGGGTFFEALDATVHVQRGHALIFPGKLRHCGQRIHKGLRFLLVGFLVDKDVPFNSYNMGSMTMTPPT